MLIVIEGCIAAGKSTVAKGLADFRGGQVLLETFEENPFLEAFYADPVGAAFETEFSFLLLHFHQLKGLSANALDTETIADFHLGKDLIFANLNLQSSQEKGLFREMHDICQARILSPSLIVFLSAETDLLLDRIGKRERSFEMKIDPDYYSMVNAAYEEWFRTYQGKKLRIPTAKWDFVEDPSLFRKLSEHIDEN